MAHRLSYRPSGYILTSSLPSVWGIFADGEYVDVRITAPGGAVILAERYYAHNGTVYLYDVASLIEAHMRAHDISCGIFTLALLDENAATVDSCTINVLYCDRFTVATETNIFLAENFLTTLSIRRVAPDSPVTLYFFAFPMESTATTVSYRWRSVSEPDDIRADTLQIAGFTVTTAGVQRVIVAQSAIKNDAYHKYDIPAVDIEVVSFTVTLGQRSATFFVDRALISDDHFTFRNCFNVPEDAYFPSVTTARTEVERSTALINRASQFYNQHVEKTYEVQTGAITFDEAEWVDQLFTSHEVTRLLPNSLDDDTYIEVPVLITESTCEVTNDDEKPNSVKFTWRYADNRPYLRLTSSPGIFNSLYNQAFS